MSRHNEPTLKPVKRGCRRYRVLIALAVLVWTATSFAFTNCEPIFGTPAQIRALDRSEFLQFLNGYYAAHPLSEAENPSPRDGVSQFNVKRGVVVIDANQFASTATTQFAADLAPGYRFVAPRELLAPPTIVFASESALRRDFEKAADDYGRWLNARIDEQVRGLNPLYGALARGILLSEREMSVEDALAPLAHLISQGLRIEIDPNLSQMLFRLNLGTRRPPVLRARSFAEIEEVANQNFGAQFRDAMVSFESEKKLNLEVEAQITNRSSSPAAARALLEAHRRFVKSGGKIIFKEPIDPSVRAYFSAPDQVDARPVIVMPNLNGVTGGTYKHELTHFRDWYLTKRKIVAGGASEDDAHTALHRYEVATDESETGRAAKQARVARWLEQHAVNRDDVYPEVEAIRRLTSTRGFTTEVLQANSSTHTSVVAYFKAAIDKVLRTYLEKNRPATSTFFGLEREVKALTIASPREQARLALFLRNRYNSEDPTRYITDEFNFKNIMTNGWLERVKDEDSRSALRAVYNSVEVKKYIAYVVRQERASRRAQAVEFLRRHGVEENWIRYITVGSESRSSREF